MTRSEIQHYEEEEEKKAVTQHNKMDPDLQCTS